MPNCGQLEADFSKKAIDLENELKELSERIDALRNENAKLSDRILYLERRVYKDGE